MFYFILNFKQLSSLSLAPCFLAWFLVVINGESHYIEWFCLSTINEGGLSRRLVPLETGEVVLFWIIFAPKNSWFKASVAFIRFDGSFYKSFRSKSKAKIINKNTFLWKFLYYAASKLNLQALFWLKTSSYYFPGKGDFLIKSKWKITPKLNISQIGLYFAFKSFRLTIYGAT
jgi:hypothetical protein